MLLLFILFIFIYEKKKKIQYLVHRKNTIKFFFYLVESNFIGCILNSEEIQVSLNICVQSNRRRCMYNELDIETIDFTNRMIILHTHIIATHGSLI